jgi:hypothetical protein
MVRCQNHDHDDVVDDDRFIASGVCRLSVEVQLDDHAPAGESQRHHLNRMILPERTKEGGANSICLHAELS